MKKENPILRYEIASTIFIFILGVILHFSYAWSNYNLFVGSFSAINESTWEHLKLLFFPMLITTVIGYSYLKKYSSNYLCAKVKGILLALSFTIIFFYTYKGVIGVNFGIVNIGSFFVAAILGEYYTYKEIKSDTKCNEMLAYSILLTLLLSFITFTFFPPHIGLFLDPVTGTYGI